MHSIDASLSNVSISRISPLFFLLLGLMLFAWAVQNLREQPRVRVASEIQVALPLFVQVGMSGGDRYLAANLATIRALITNTSAMTSDQFEILARVQEDASWLNPANEDNYYIAAAVLPWNGRIDEAQQILYRASVARPYDYQPAFLYAFNLFYFKGEIFPAAEWLRRAAEKLDDDEKLALQNIAAKWVDNSLDLDNAIGVVSGLAKQAKRKDFRLYLETRVERLRMLKMLRAKAALFRQQNGRGITSVDELVSSGLIKSLPQDPFNFGFDIDKRGEVVLRTSEPNK